MRIINNSLLVIMPYIILLAISYIYTGAAKATDEMLEPSYKILGCVLCGVILFFFVLFIFKNCPVKEKSTLVCLIIGLFIDVSLVPLYYFTTIGLFPSEIGISLELIIVAVAFFALLYCRGIGSFFYKKK